MARTISLQITLPDGRAVAQSFENDTVLIGSGPSAVLRIEDADVSSIHAVVKAAADGSLSVVDLGSESGTTVNGKPVTEPTPIRPGDSIRLGRAEIIVKAPESARPSAPAPAAKPSAPPAAPRASVPPAAPRPSAPPPAAQAAGPAHAHAAGHAHAHAPGHAHALSGENFFAAKEAPPAFGQRVVRAEADLDLSVLSTPLDESNRPTAEKHALEVSVLWGDEVIDTVQVREPRDIRVGAFGDRKCDLQVAAENLPVEAFTIASNRGNEAQIVVPQGAQIGLRREDGAILREVQLAGTDAPFPAKAYSLRFGERLAFKSGTLTFVAQYVRGEAELGKAQQVDWFFPRIFTIMALLHVFFVIAAFITPKLSSSLTDDLFKNQNRIASMILKAPEKEKQKKKLELSGAKGAKAKDDEGKFGKKELPKKDALASKAGAPRVDAKKREEDRKIAMNAGLLGILKGASGKGAVSNVFGPGGLGSGINSAMGGLRGADMGDAGGAGGLGSRGAGAGGGGDSLGIGGLGTHGHGRGSGGYGNIDLGGRGKGTMRIEPGRTIVQGSLSKEEIGRVIRRNLARFKYCYEKELNANPNLNGKVSVYFTIAPTGDVADASVRETSMNDQNVEQCVLKVMRSLKFPQPRGGGIVVVTYPFVFAAT